MESKIDQAWEKCTLPTKRNPSHKKRTRPIQEGSPEGKNTDRTRGQGKHPSSAQ
jgi:hypothetical protein